MKMCSLPLLCELALVWSFDRYCVLFARLTLNFVCTSQLFCKVPKEWATEFGKVKCSKRPIKLAPTIRRLDFYSRGIQFEFR